MVTHEHRGNSRIRFNKQHHLLGNVIVELLNMLGIITTHADNFTWGNRLTVTHDLIQTMFSFYNCDNN